MLKNKKLKKIKAGHAGGGVGEFVILYETSVWHGSCLAISVPQCQEFIFIYFLARANKGLTVRYLYAIINV